METHSPSIKKTALNFGVLLALLTIALQVVSYAMDAHIDRPWWLGVVQLIISVGIVIMGLKAFRTDNSGFLTLGQALKTGIAISLVAGIIAVIFNYIFINFIDPDFIQKTMDFTEEQMIEQNPNMSQEERDLAMDISAKFMSPLVMSAISLLFTLFMGFIISLIAGLILKRNPPHQL